MWTKSDGVLRASSIDKLNYRFRKHANQRDIYVASYSKAFNMFIMMYLFWYIKKEHSVEFIRKYKFGLLITPCNTFFAMRDVETMNRVILTIN